MIASLTVSSRLDCTFECLTNPQCVSVNFKEEGNPLHVCELNEESRKSADSSFVSRLGYTYYDSNDVSELLVSNLNYCIDLIYRLEKRIRSILFK